MHSISNLNQLNRFFRRDNLRLFYPTTINSHSGYWPIWVNSTGWILTLWRIRLRSTVHTRLKSGASLAVSASLPFISTYFFLLNTIYPASTSNPTAQIFLFFLKKILFFYEIQFDFLLICCEIYESLKYKS